MNSVAPQGRDSSVCSAADTRQIIVTPGHRDLCEDTTDWSRPITAEEAPVC